MGRSFRPDPTDYSLYVRLELSRNLIEWDTLRVQPASFLLPLSICSRSASSRAENPIGASNLGGDLEPFGAGFALPILFGFSNRLR